MFILFYGPRGRIASKSLHPTLQAVTCPTTRAIVDRMFLVDAYFDSPKARFVAEYKKTLLGVATKAHQQNIVNYANTHPEWVEELSAIVRISLDILQF